MIIMAQALGQGSAMPSLTVHAATQSLYWLSSPDSAERSVQLAPVPPEGTGTAMLFGWSVLKARFKPREVEVEEEPWPPPAIARLHAVSDESMKMLYQQVLKTDLETLKVSVTGAGLSFAEVPEVQEVGPVYETLTGSDKTKYFYFILDTIRMDCSNKLLTYNTVMGGPSIKELKRLMSEEFQKSTDPADMGSSRYLWRNAQNRPVFLSSSVDEQALRDGSSNRTRIAGCAAERWEMYPKSAGIDPINPIDPPNPNDPIDHSDQNECH